MSTIKVTDAGDELFGVDEAKTHLNETLADALNDEYIDTLIQLVRVEAENALQRTLITCTWQLTLDAFPMRTGSSYPPAWPMLASSRAWPASGPITLLKPPIQSIDWVKYVDVNGVLQTLDPSAYRLVKKEPGELWPTYGASWPTAQDVAGAVQVQFKAGYGDDASAVPMPIIHWCKLALSELYEGRSLNAELYDGKARAAEGNLHTFAQGLLDVYKVRPI
jgi:hypothetical protein